MRNTGARVRKPDIEALRDLKVRLLKDNHISDVFDDTGEGKTLTVGQLMHARTVFREAGYSLGGHVSLTNAPVPYSEDFDAHSIKRSRRILKPQRQI